ncbi:MAG: acyl-CoA thioesterase [Hamadaea sp.]|nr:acyl-CoA thioesterase [Hamadaea sp.]
MTETLQYAGVIRQVVVHFDDLDPSAVVHNSRYALLLERAVSTWFSDHGYSFANGRPSSEDMVVGVREFAITYNVPIRGTGPIDVHFWIDKLGRSSAVYGFRFLSPDHTTVYAEGRRVMVKMDFATGVPVPWTEDGLALVEPLVRR